MQRRRNEFCRSVECDDRSRRRFLARGGHACGALLLMEHTRNQRNRRGTRAAAEIVPPVRTDDDVDELLPSLTNWGRWGKEDQLGTLNFITPERRRRAAKLVRTGRAVSLSRETALAKTEGVRRGAHEVQRDADGCRDFIAMVFHGFAMTHLDALCHVFADRGRMYNGFPVDAVTEEGAARLGSDVMARQGISGRGCSWTSPL